MSRPIWFVNLVKKSFPTRFALASFTKAPLVGRFIDHALFGGDDIIYLPKDNLIPVNETIDRPADTVLPSDVVAHFIEQSEYHWIMDFCICRVSDQCADFPRHLGCIFLGKAVTKINPKLGRLASKEEALAHLRLCQEAGLVHMIGRNKLDTIWLGATPGNQLLTICNCCPCCCLWRVLPHVDQAIGDKITRMPGVKVTVNDGCRGCKLCIREVCFVDAIHMDGNQAVIDDGRCRGCGRCVEVCPLDVIELTFGASSSVDESINRLTPLVELSPHVGASRAVSERP
jgi:ferredoxin